jgi:hypothetical protein
LIGEDNSSLQATLWRDALFILGKNFPNSWEHTNIKKNFLPKLYQSLKASGFGSPSALYDNFVKFVSIFPLYHLVDYKEDKLNKASFKERASLLRETLTTLYQGLKNDEAVAFHQDLMKSYFETFAFLLLKRLTPLLSSSSSEEDKDFALSQFKKCIQLPLEDFLNNYEKFNSKVQNQRNIRVTIPSQISKFLSDIGERQIDERVFKTICSYMLESLVLQLDKHNAIRLLSALMKSCKGYRDFVIQEVIISYYKAVVAKIIADIDNLGKDNIDAALLKAENAQ